MRIPQEVKPHSKNDIGEYYVVCVSYYRGIYIGESENSHGEKFVESEKFHECYENLNFTDFPIYTVLEKTELKALLKEEEVKDYYNKMSIFIDGDKLLWDIMS